MVFQFPILLLLSFIYYKMSLKQNYQNYKYLSYIIASSIILAIVVCIALSIYGMTNDEWNKDFYKQDENVKQ